MEDNFVNNITVDSFGYDLYGFDGPKQIKETISSSTSISITENVDFYIQETIENSFTCNFDAVGIITIGAIQKTNFFENPSLESDTASWSSTANVTISRVTTDSYSGSSSLKAISTTSSSISTVSVQTPSGVVNPYQTLTGSAYVKNIAGVNRNVGIIIWFRNSTGGVVGAVVGTPAATEVGDDWSRLTVTASAPVNTSYVVLEIYIQGSNGQIGNELLIDAAQMEISDTATEYFEGTVVTDPSPIDVFATTVASVGAIIMHPASATIFCSTGVELYSTDLFSPSIIEDSFNIKAFFILDDIPLSEHNRITSSSIQVLNTSASNWRGRKSVYYKTNGIKKTFNFQWRMLPGKRENTVDYNSGRDYIKNKASDAREHTLEIRNIDTDGTTAYTTEVYNVLITEYSESLVRRDLVGNDYYWDCSLILQEV